MFRLHNLLVGLLLMGLVGCTAPVEQDAGPESEQQSGLGTATTYQGDSVGHWSVGRPASAEQIAAWDIDVRPDGVGLPVGSGSVEDGEWLYEDLCAECHGSFGEGVGRYPVLSGGVGSLRDDRPSKTVGSFWPYTSTLYDYIYRAMPFTQPESLTPDETYAITAYVLYLNDLIADDFVLTHENLAGIRLPNEPNFTPDPRPDVANVRCMQNCRDGAEIVFHSEVAPLALATVAGAGDAAHRAEDGAQEHVGKGTYDQYCSICHKVGVGGAPMLGDAAAWQSRLAPGLDAVIANALNGTSSESGVMPAKGGFAQLSDEAVGQAVRYMVEESQ